MGISSWGRSMRSSVYGSPDPPALAARRRVAYIRAMSHPDAFREIADNLSFLDDWEDRYKYIIELGQKLPPLASQPALLFWESYLIVMVSPACFSFVSLVSGIVSAP